MNRSFHQFPCEGDMLAGSLDAGPKKTGILIVSGGNEIRSGAHSGMAHLAQMLSNKGYPVFRYDRRGIGDSSGENAEFLHSGPDIVAASRYFRTCCPDIEKILAFGNCDAATALTLFASEAGIDRLALANPWVIEVDEDALEKPTAPPPSAIRSRYWERLKNPQTIIDLFRGQIDFKKLLKGIKQALQKQENTGLSLRLRDALLNSAIPGRILLANQDTTARAFIAAWESNDYRSVRDRDQLDMRSIDSASHSFADAASKAWLEDQLVEMLEKT